MDEDNEGLLHYGLPEIELFSLFQSGKIAFLEVELFSLGKIGKTALSREQHNV